MPIASQKESSIPLLIFSRSPFHDSLRHACRETWLSALRPEIRPIFFVNCPDLGVDQRFDGDVLRVRCGGNVCGHQTVRGLRAVLGRFTFPWLYICNETCWVNPWRFNAYPFWDWDVTGVWDSGNGAMSLSRRAASFLLKALEAGAEGDIEELLMRLPAAKVLRTTKRTPYRADCWEPCLVTYGVPTQEAMKDLHTKALRYETLAGLAPPLREDSAECSAARISKSNVRLRNPSSNFPHNGRIFVQIAAYREADLANSPARPFLQGCRRRSIACWRLLAARGGDSLEEFAEDPRLCVDAIPAREAKGLGWARSRAQRLYEDEEFNLQIDGHTRFIEGWDEVLIRMLAEADAPKPILTTYPKCFVPGEPLPPGSSLLH